MKERSKTVTRDTAVRSKKYIKSPSIKSRRKRQHRKTKSVKSEPKTKRQKIEKFDRGIYRKHPICWYNATLQLIKCIPWPITFETYCNSERNAFATVFKMMSKLNEPLSTPISAKACSAAAKNFIQKNKK